MKEKEGSRNRTLLLSIIAVVALIVVVGGATFAFFATTRDIDASTPVNTQTASKSYTFIASANENIEFNLSASEMSEASASTNVLKSDTANINVEVASATDEEITTCTYDIAWVWDSADKYTESDVTLPHTDGDKSYPYELSITVDGENETDLSNLTWTDGKAIVASGIEIQATNTTPVKFTNQIEVKVYNIPVDQQKLFNKNFKAHLEVVNNSCTLTKNQIIASAYNNTHEYDGNAKSLEINVANAQNSTIYYSTSPLNESNYTSGSTTPPTRTEYGSTKVYWCAVDNDNKYATYCTNSEIIVTKNLVQYITKDVYAADGVNGLYYHDGNGTYTNANLEAGDNSYRYAGTDPNNYLCFKEGCTDDEKYRIIGIIDNKVKVIKMSNDGDRAWNSTDVKNWIGSTMEKYLNGEYLTKLGDTANLIDTTTWYVGGYEWIKTTTDNAKKIYTAELSSTPTIKRKVGLMYVSDYMYAAEPIYWSLVGYDINNDASKDYRASKGYDWILTAKKNEWTISCASDSSNIASYVNSSGQLLGHSTVSSMYNVHPSFSLLSSVKLKGGSGTKSNPFIVGL